jgi:hypothetical protein
MSFLWEVKFLNSHISARIGIGLKDPSAVAELCEKKHDIIVRERRGQDK